MDFHPSEHEVPVTIMTAIKCQDDRVGERGARPDWVWEHWQHDFVFRPESEVWGENATLLGQPAQVLTRIFSLFPTSSFRDSTTLSNPRDGLPRHLCSNTLAYRASVLFSTFCLLCPP